MLVVEVKTQDGTLCDAIFDAKIDIELRAGTEGSLGIIDIEAPWRNSRRDDVVKREVKSAWEKRLVEDCGNPRLIRAGAGSLGEAVEMIVFT